MTDVSIGARSPVKVNKQIRVRTPEKKPKWLAVFLFVASVLYLFPETVFNAKLVEVAGGANVSDEKLHLIELFGRTISGIGVTLLLADSLLKGWFTATKARAVLSLIGITLIVWPTVFFGQKILIDKLLVEPSSPKQRQEAFFSSVLRSSLALNALNIKGIPYNADNAAKPSEMTFLAMLGGLVYVNDEFLEHVESQKRTILEKYIKNRAAANFDEHYGKYTEMRAKVQDSWKQYQSKVAEYNKGVSSRWQRADKAWETVESTIAKGYSDYQKAENAYLARAEARAQKVAPKIYDHWDDRNRCIKRYQKNASRRSECIRNEEKQYARTLEKASIPFKPMEYFAYVKERVRGETSWGQTGRTLGLSALFAGIEQLQGKGGEVEKHYTYTNEVAFYTPKILNLWQDNFKRETGYPMGIKTIREFRNHKTTSSKVRAKVKSTHGVVLPDSWTVVQIKTFKSTVAKKVVSEANSRWHTEARKKGYDIEPNLSWTQFQKLPMIQQRIKEEMGERYYVKPVLASWNNQQFYNHVIMPNIVKERDYWIHYIEASRKQFKDGAPFAEKGKTALRSIIVPPISMSLSLLLVILTVFKLPIKFINLMNYDKPVDPVTTKKRVMSIGSSVAIFAVIFIVPLQMFSSKFTQEGSTTSYFLNKMSDSLSPTSSMAIKWVIHTQPIIQPIGAAIDGGLNITNAFEATLEHSIGVLDKHVMDALGMTSVTERNADASDTVKEQLRNAAKTGKLAEYPIKIITNVPGAKIRVMNIGPKYREGMILPVGNYDISVEAPGFRSKRIWVSHRKNKTSHRVNLERI